MKLAGAESQPVEAPRSGVGPPGAASGSWRTLVVAFLVFLLPVAVLWPYRAALPVSDDFLFTRAAPPIDVAWALRHGWEHSLGRTSAYRPVTTATYRANQMWCAGVGRMSCYRLTNYLMHGACAASVLFLALALGLSLPFAGVAAVAFALHPASHENVLWISGRTYPLAALFALWTLVIAASPARTSRPGWAWLAGGLTLISLGSYEGVVGLPLVAIAVQWTTARHRGRGVAPVFAAVQLAALAVYAGFRWIALTSLAGDLWMYGNELSTALGRPGLLHRLAANGWYFAARGLASGKVPVTVISGAFLVTLVTLAILAPAAFARREPRPVLLAAAALGIGAVAPFMPTAAIADRFTYLSLVAVALILAAGLEATWLRRTTWRPLLAAGALALLLVWSRQYLITAQEWFRAGEIGERVLTESLAHVREHPEATAVELFQVPSREGRAHVLITYFEWEFLRRAGRNIGVTGHLADAPPGIAAPTGTLWLRWNRGTQHVERVAP